MLFYYIYVLYVYDIDETQPNSSNLYIIIYLSDVIK